MKYLLLNLALVFSVPFCNTQILYDFNADTSDDWQIEGDGALGWESDAGNPDGCLRIDDDATGDIIILVSPPGILGDWSSSSNSDTLKMDLYVDYFTNNLIPNLPFVFQISGPGGTANALPNYIPANDAEWDNVSVSLNPADWVLVDGDWELLLKSVELFKIRVEYNDGDEFVRVDNLSLSFSPVIRNVTGFTCSTFETLDGWSFQSTGGFSVNAFGNPGPSIKIDDALGAFSTGLAPPKFRGNWGQLETSDSLRLDLYIDSSDPDIFDSVDLVTLSGNGNSAIGRIYNVDDAYNQWHTFIFAIDSTQWIITEGTWEGLMENVQQIRLQLEFIIGNEDVYLDNFCIGDKECPNLLILKNDTLQESIFASEAIFLDSVWINQDVIISAPEVELIKAVQNQLGFSLEVNQDGCN